MKLARHDSLPVRKGEIYSSKATAVALLGAIAVGGLVGGAAGYGVVAVKQGRDVAPKIVTDDKATGGDIKTLTYEQTSLECPAISVHELSTLYTLGVEIGGKWQPDVLTMTAEYQPGSKATVLSCVPAEAVTIETTEVDDDGPSAIRVDIDATNLQASYDVTNSDTGTRSSEGSAVQVAQGATDVIVGTLVPACQLIFGRGDACDSLQKAPDWFETNRSALETRLEVETKQAVLRCTGQEFEQQKQYIEEFYNGQIAENLDITPQEAAAMTNYNYQGSNEDQERPRSGSDNQEKTIATFTSVDETLDTVKFSELPGLRGDAAFENNTNCQPIEQGPNEEVVQ